MSVRMMYFTPETISSELCKQCKGWRPWGKQSAPPTDVRTLTPYDVRYGRTPEVLAQRQRIMDVAYAAHSERFVRGIPKIQPLPEAVWINPPATSTKAEIAP